MESEITTAETGLELPLPEPHFDDEATVLSARRVVPLDEVEPYEAQTQSRSPHWWVFAATIAGAMLLGVVIGAAYYSYASRESAHALVDTESIAAGVDGLSTESPSTSGAFGANHTAAADPNTDLGTRQVSTAAPQPEVSANESRKPTARRVDVLTFPSTHEETQAREERKIRREARKRIRELEREGRDPKSRNDLTRIREIFEGPQRP